jgi:hypothetical protein
MSDEREREPSAPPAPVMPPLWFKQSPVRLHPGEKRSVTLYADPASVPAGAIVEMEADAGLSLTLRSPEVPAPGARGYSTLQIVIRAKVTVEPGSRLLVQEPPVSTPANWRS